MSNWNFLSDYFSWFSPSDKNDETKKKKGCRTNGDDVNNKKNKNELANNTKRVKKYNPNDPNAKLFVTGYNEEETFINENEIDNKENQTRANLEKKIKSKKENENGNEKGVEAEGGGGGLLNQLGISNWLPSYDLSAMNDYKRGYYLDKEAKEILPKKNVKKGNVIKIDANGNPEFEDPLQIKKENRIVVDTTYYDCLNVSTDATLGQIKNSYYKLALKYHPDKNQDPEAKVKFQKISEAYQILSDEERRAKYDRYGIKATKDMILIDPSIFFMMLFSSEELISYIGTLRIAFFVQMSFEGNMSIEDKKTSNEKIMDELEVEQAIREVELALSLRERLEPYVQNDEKWETNMETEIKGLLESSFSSSILESIGWTYENVATSYIAEVTTLWGVGATVANIQAASRTIGNTFCAAKSVINTVVTIKDISGKHEKRSAAKMEDATSSKDPVNYHIQDALNNTNTNKGNNNDHRNISEEKKHWSETHMKKTSNVDMKPNGETHDPKSKKNDSVYNNTNNTTTTNNENTEEVDDIKNNFIDASNYLKEENKALGSILKNMLTLVLWDIESTVRQAASKVVRDEGVDVKVRLKRAEGMKLLGQLMQKWARTKKDVSNSEGDVEFNATKLLENALVKATQMAGEEEDEQQQ